MIFAVTADDPDNVLDAVSLDGVDAFRNLYTKTVLKVATRKRVLNAPTCVTAYFESRKHLPLIIHNRRKLSLRYNSILPYYGTLCPNPSKTKMNNIHLEIRQKVIKYRSFLPSKVLYIDMRFHFCHQMQATTFITASPALTNESLSRSYVLENLICRA